MPANTFVSNWSQQYFVPCILTFFKLYKTFLTGYGYGLYIAEFFNQQIEAIKRGLLKVLSQAVLDLLTWQELERRVCGDPQLSVEALKRCSEFGFQLWAS